MNVKLIISAAVGLLLMGLSWYAYSTTKALGAAELANKQLLVSLEEFGQRMVRLDQAFMKSREIHQSVERDLKRRIGELRRVKVQPCFDDPIPDAAADILRDLPGIDGMPEAARSSGGSDTPSGSSGADHPSVLSDLGG